MVAISIVAFLLREYQLGWGLPDYHFPDEAWILEQADGVGTAKQLFMYPHAHLYVIRYARMVSEWLGSGNDLATSIRLARQIGVVFSLATIWAVYGIARVLFSTRTALTAAAFLAVTPYHAAYVRIFSLDLPATFWTTVSLLFAATAFARRRLSMCVFAGLAAGIAAGTKYNAGVVVVPALFLCGRESWHRLRSGRGNAALPLAAAMAVCLAAFVGFAATNPQCLMQAEVCGKHVALISALQRAGTMESLGIGSWVRTRYLYQTLVALPFALGWPLYLLSLAGITMSVCLRRCAGALLLFTYVAAYFVVLGIPKTAAVRYCLPLLPVLAVFAA